ncbi:MAG: hypothetical protein B7Y03_10705 [Polaromonas sp. 24-62-144]|nr:MAG: hypothetical protein B7Y54_10215 [Polaromonas sp. 35-63-240]OYY96354.1 MAG: hypothetical protein B7Y42_09385 [Polaromonas sp. 28-63-22]OYZ82676.1 MAG: hypothetical protein B7Y03_10705 [Polaromonas sp. 24-62-144]
MCATPPGRQDKPAPPSGQQHWTPLQTLMPVAAALRDLKQWSLDGPVMRFDAQDWWYRLEFDAPAASEGGTVQLGFDGLATLATVWLNGAPLLASTNMFVFHVCDVSERLMPAGNELLLCFHALDTALAVRRPRPRWRAPMLEHQQMRWFRTTLVGRTPGWSPPGAVVGPWKDIWLEQRHAIDLQTLSLRPQVVAGMGLVTCGLRVVALSGGNIESVRLILERGGRVHETDLQPGGAANTFTGQLQIPEVKLWWPHTHGEPALYKPALTIRVAGLAEPVVMELACLGFRTITLDRSAGNFSISVNDVPVFCRGACWTPLDPVTLRSSPQDCRAAVVQARSAGMNMLRVAGTTVYEEEHFFDACNEEGMLVWQDFMFANMDYPEDDEPFMTSVALEISQQLQRLQARACVALLCGNSEVAQQAAMWGASRDVWHSTFFADTLARLCHDVIPGTPYWPSSACGGSFPHQASAGTTSYYGVGAYLRGLDDARRSELKFATECLAFANVPSTPTLERMPGGLATRTHHAAWKARSPRDLAAGWDFDDVRDHYLALLFKTEPLKLRSTSHDRYLTLARVTTGEVMAAAFEEWRRPTSACNGALVLGLRDLWAGAGWGLVDDQGLPKPCFHYLKRVLQPLAVSISDEGINGLFVHILNEHPEDKPVELEVTAWRGGEVLIARASRSCNLPARSAQSLSCMDLFDHFLDLNHAYRFGPPPCDAVAATLKGSDGALLAQTFFFPEGLGRQPEDDVGLRAHARPHAHDSQTIELTLQTRKLAQAVHVDVPGFAADDDYFHMAPDTERTVMLRGHARQPFEGFVHALNSTRSARIEPAPTSPDQRDRPAEGNLT